MSIDPSLPPDEVALRRDLATLPFRIGVNRDRWALAALQFPIAYVRIRGPARELGPETFLLRIDCAGYRATAPTAALWDGRSDTALTEDLRPRRADGQLVIAFSSGCGQCLYHPIDRMARSHWPNNHADLAWSPGSDIVTFLECVHGLLDSSDYRSSAAPSAAAYLRSEGVEPAALGAA